jgi:hypothetical protein
MRGRKAEAYTWCRVVGWQVSEVVDGRERIDSSRELAMFLCCAAAALTRPPSCGLSALRSDGDADPGRRPGQFVRTVCGGPG